MHPQVKAAYDAMSADARETMQRSLAAMPLDRLQDRLRRIESELTALLSGPTDLNKAIALSVETVFIEEEVERRKKA